MSTKRVHWLGVNQQVPVAYRADQGGCAQRLAPEATMNCSSWTEGRGGTSPSLRMAYMLPTARLTAPRRWIAWSGFGPRAGRSSNSRPGVLVARAPERHVIICASHELTANN